MITGPNAYYTILNTLLTSVNQALADKPDRVCVVPGAIAWDECECGLLAGTVVRWFFTDNFPVERTTIAGNCDAAFVAADLKIAILRCAPQPDDGELAPKCSELDTAAKILISDAFTVRQEVTKKLCEMKAADDITEFITRNQTPVGPGGMCVGTEFDVSVAIDRQ